MKASSVFFWFFIFGGFITAAVAVGYFASGESFRATDQENYTILIQIPIGIACTLYGLQKRSESRSR